LVDEQQLADKAELAVKGRAVDIAGRGKSSQACRNIPES
jgi:hypothetical protein